MGHRSQERIMKNNSKQCPCCSNLDYEQCCKLYIEDGLLVPDPVTLMRSRYTAFVLKNLNYIRTSWYPDTVPELSHDEASNWIHLEILGSDIEENDGEVEFVAKLIIGDKLETLHEISEFVKIDGKWLYYSGDFENEESDVQKISMK